jgi:hypothetical protein
MIILWRFLFLTIIITAVIVKCNIYQWTEWTKWNEKEKCERNCSEEYGKLKMKRNCKKCYGNICEIVNQSSCSNEPYEKFDLCYYPEDCEGDGFYTGIWSEFKDTPGCNLVSKTCNSTYQEGFQKRERNCLNTKKSNQLAKKHKKYIVKCAGNSIEYSICKVILIYICFSKLYSFF